MKTYIVILKDNSYNKNFQYLLKRNYINFEYIKEMNQYILVINNDWVNYIKKLYYVKNVIEESTDKPTNSIIDETTKTSQPIVLNDEENSNNSTSINFSIPSVPISPDAPNNYINDWVIEKMNVKTFWDKGFHGQHVKIGVLDSGISEHKYMVSNIKKELSFIFKEPAPNDTLGMGTGVAGAIVGIAHKCEIYSLKVIDREGNIYMSSILDAIGWCLDNSIDIIYIGFSAYLQCKEYNILSRALKDAESLGKIIVASAGDENIETTEGCIQQNLISTIPSVIGIGAIDKHNNLWKDGVYASNRGYAIDFVEPGENIRTTNLNDDYKYISGTGAASALATGLMALYISKNRPNQMNKDIMYNILKSKSISLPQGQSPDKNKYGEGIAIAY